MSGEGGELSVRMARYVAVEEEKAPPSRVDPALAVRRGRAVLRRRTWAVVSAAAAAAVVLSAGSFAVLGSGGGADPAGTGVPRQGRSPSGGNAATGRTVLTVPGRFGWLPDSVTTVEYRADSTGVSVVAGGADADAGGRFHLTAFPEGVVPDVDPLIGGGDGLRLAAPPVNGQDAYWVSTTDQGYALAMNVLRFRGTNGVWFELDSTGLGGADRQEVPLRVAAGVVPGRYTPPMPLALSTLPVRALVTGAELSLPVRADGGWRASVELREEGGPYLRVSVESEGSSGSAAPDGTPTWAVDHQSCDSAGGVRRCAAAMQSVAGSGVGDPAAWLDRVVARGTDEAAWSVDVLP
ncbi:hypothetical protein [Kitasatospora sp. NPDC057198]|uniref:hypothetical protein n=1 Tax=Kitasatospora sp. NPDC057198 TaxID=3346046 RepID=UPI0036298E91